MRKQYIIRLKNGAVIFADYYKQKDMLANIPIEDIESLDIKRVPEERISFVPKFLRRTKSNYTF